MADTTERREIAISVNGEARRVPAGETVAGLLRRLGLAGRPVAVERNRVVLRRADLATTALQDGDRLEIVTFLGGG